MISRVVFFAMMFMLSSNGVLGQLRGRGGEPAGNPTEVKREKVISRGRREILERVPRTFKDPLSGKEDTRQHRVRLVRLPVGSPACSFIFELFALFAACP